MQRNDLDWLIVGGGVHGVHLAARLIGEAGVAPGRLRILDPAERLLARWRACTATTGMTHLRSPGVHHLGLGPNDLLDYASPRRRLEPSLFEPPYDRPSLRLFNDHCDRIVREFGLADLHVRAAARTCTVECSNVRVDADGDETFVAHNVILALGSNRPHRPEWARVRHPRVQHVFDHGFSCDAFRPGDSVAVVGGGVSAAQIALRLLDVGQRVTLISRHPLREHQFDSDPGWLGPKHMARFLRVRDFERRRQIIKSSRYSGSVPPDVSGPLRRHIERGRIQWVEDSVSETVLADDGVGLVFANGERIDVHRVYLATGFAPDRPGGELVDGLVASASLPCASCGFPIVDKQLRWHARVHVSGALAELELGPAARNISGARRAGDRILAAI